MTSQPFVTVVTVTFNDLANLRATVDSLREQSGDDWEHLVVDGGSTDGSVEFLATKPLGARSTYMSEPDRGLFDAMNKGLRLARGEVVMFLNSGDLYARPSVLAEVAQRFRQNNAEWGYGRATIVDSGGQPFRPPTGIDPYTPRRHAYLLSAVNHQATAVRRAFALELGGFDFEQFGAAADYHFLLRAGCLAKPLVWSSIDVEYLAGGLSEVDVFPQLFRRHRARVHVLQLSPAPAKLDAAFTCLQVAVVFGRRHAKRLVRRLGGQRIIVWRASRSVPGRGD